MAREAPAWWWARDKAARSPGVRAIWPVLRLGEMVYGRVIRRRNATYDRRLQGDDLFRPPVPTISVGNITVGGSGKTPLTIWLAGMLWTKGLRPGVVARGYGSDGSELNDELRLVLQKSPYAAVTANPDREQGIREVVTLDQVAAVILDDAFQHRRVGRDLDIVLVDATRGFGNGHLLPAGPLREPVASLRRADMVVLTRTEQVDCGELDRLQQAVLEAAGAEVPVGRVRFERSGVTDLGFAPVESPGGPGGAFAGVGNFGAFVETCRQGGLDVAGRMPLPDHCRYDAKLCRRIGQWAMANRLTWLVTTEKDAVKLAQVGWDWPVPVLVLAIRVVPDEPTRKTLEDLVETTLASAGT